MGIVETTTFATIYVENFENSSIFKLIMTTSFTQIIDYIFLIEEWFLNNAARLSLSLKSTRPHF